MEPDGARWSLMELDGARWSLLGGANMYFISYVLRTKLKSTYILEIEDFSLEI